MDEWTKKVWYVVECYSAINRMKVCHLCNMNEAGGHSVK
jgi:ribosomal protein S3AE